MVRSVGPRLSVAAEYQECAVETPPGGTIERTICAAISPPDGWLDLAGRAVAGGRHGADPDALHAVALIDLLWGDRTGIALRRSIEYMETAARLATRPAPVLVDLAAAYLVMAELTQNPRALLDAIETAQRAVELEPAGAAGRFNLALALDRLGLDGEARREWESVLALESASGWADEARHRVGRLPRVRPTSPAPGPGAAAADVEAFVASSTQAALELGWDRALPGWGAAKLGGDTAAAGAWLQLAEGLGLALARRGDATLADEVRSIRSRGGRPRSLRKRAAAHRDYGRGRAAVAATDYDVAHRHFADALAAADRGSAVAGWAGLWYGVTLAYDGQAAAAERRLAELAARTDTLRHPALAGRTRSALGSLGHRGGRSDEARAWFESAMRLLERAGEHDHLGAIAGALADLEFSVGDDDAGFRRLHYSLGTLRRAARRSVWLHNLLYVAAEEAAAAGRLRAALRLQDEGVRVADGLNAPVYGAEARLARARLRIAVGDSSGARDDVRASRQIVDRLDGGYMRSWLEAELRLAQASIAPHARDLVALDSVVAFFETRQVPLRLLPALAVRARARLTHGNAAGAQADLDRVIHLREEQGAAIADAPLRAALMDATRDVFDRMAILQIERGEPAAALAYVRRGRAWHGAGEVLRDAVRPGELGLDYALVGDRVMVWTIAGTAVHLMPLEVEPARLFGVLDRARAALELHAVGDARPELEQLYEWLVRPVESRIPPGAVLDVSMDGELAGIPWPALFDRRRNQYLIERHALRFAGYRRASATAGAVVGGSANAALLVADPAFDRHENPGLERLGGASAEIEAVATSYPSAARVAGAAAHRSALLEAMPRAAVIHFAGHAVFDDERPQRSYLVLAPDPGTFGTGRLSAADLALLDLHGVRLVVLSACQTLRSRATRAGGLLGFADALLAAGAGGVIGSLWRVDDRLTGSLMAELHRAYAHSGDGATALRDAQLSLLRSPDPALRSPAAWAAFRYAGR